MGYFVCPICKKPLINEGRSLVCQNRHSFDVAKQGYVHLLPSDRMRAKIPGDSKEMVLARSSFLNAGGYEPFSDEINRIARGLLSGVRSPVVLDAGCGEGYYTARLSSALVESGSAPVLAGLDISKFAVREAAKRSPGVEFAVGSLFAIPAPDGSADFLLNVFAPIVPAEFCRAVKKGGHLLIAVAGPRHLFGMKEILYERPYENETKDTDYPGFRFISRTPVRSELTLRDPALIEALFSMTPYYWKTSAAGASRLRKRDALHTETGFDLLLYQRTGKI